MKISPKKISIDSTVEGNGDIWMRLVSLYTVSGLLPDLEIHILIPVFLRNLARLAFADRLFIMEDTGEKIKLKYTALGMRHLLKGFVKGNKYILPYQRAIINDKKNQLKDKLNIKLFNFASYLGLVQIPDWKWINHYQGHLDIIGIKTLKQINYDIFVEQLQSDHDLTYRKLQEIPFSSELKIPLNLNQHILVFPTGTSRQFIPVWWAKQYLPEAYFAFFHKDEDTYSFEKAGLKTVHFYKEPDDIIALSHHAMWTISTDSFPSHILQSAATKCTITLTEVLKSRIISPAFRGKVVDATAGCHPCLHLDRKNHPKCAAGYVECINWKDKTYSGNILQSISAE